MNDYINDSPVWDPLSALRRMADAKWLIDGVLPQDAAALVFGEPGSFKSFMAMDMAVAVASGQQWQGKETSQAIVVYLAAEGGDDVHLRRAGAQKARGITTDIPLAVVQFRPQLDESAGLDALTTLVEGACGRDFDRWNRTSAYDDERYLTKEEREQIEAETGDNFDRMLESIRAMVWPRMNAADRASVEAQEAAEDALKGNFNHHRHRALSNVLLIVDTYAQVCADDTKAVFSRYTRTLLDLQERARRFANLSVTVLTVDHTTKGGDTFMGSIAKLGNNDTMMMVERADKSRSLKLTCLKQKNAPKFEPMHLDLVDVRMEGFVDGYGRTLQTLSVTDGTRSARLRHAVGAEGDTASARILGLLSDGGPLHIDDLRNRFLELPTNTEKKAETVKRSFRRAIEGLTEDELIETNDADMVWAVT